MVNYSPKTDHIKISEITINPYYALENESQETSSLFEDTAPKLLASLDTNGKTFNKSSYRQIADGAIAATGTYTFNYANGDFQELTLSGTAITATLAFSNFIVGEVCTMVIDLVNAGAQTVAYPAGTLFTAGAEPTLTAAGTDRLIITKDGVNNTYTIGVWGLDIKAVV